MAPEPREASWTAPKLALWGSKSRRYVRETAHCQRFRISRFLLSEFMLKNFANHPLAG